MTPTIEGPAPDDETRSAQSNDAVSKDIRPTADENRAPDHLPKNHSPDSLLTPQGMVKAARKAHPAFKYAIVVAGIAALVAIVVRFGVSPPVLVFGVIIALFFMFVFLIFAIAVREKKRRQYGSVALVVLWALAVLFIAILCLLLSSTFFDSPIHLRSALEQLISADRAKPMQPQPVTSSPVAETPAALLKQDDRKTVTEFSPNPVNAAPSLTNKISIEVEAFEPMFRLPEPYPNYGKIPGEGYVPLTFSLYGAVSSSLDFRVVNNSDRTIYFQEVILKEIQSVPDPRPDLGWFGFFDFRVKHAPLRIWNDGGPASNVALIATCTRETEKGVLEKRDFRREIGEIVSEAEISVDQILFDLFGRREPSPGEEFHIKGKLVYKFKDRDARMAEGSDKVYLTICKCPDTKPHAYMGSSRTYSLTLQADARDYELSVPISQVLKPQDADRFEVDFTTTNPSIHHFHLFLRDADHQEFDCGRYQILLRGDQPPRLAPPEYGGHTKDPLRRLRFPKF